MLKVVAPAKINLTLEVLKKREDGYHEIRSIVQTLSLHDATLKVELVIGLVGGCLVRHTVVER